MKTKVEFDQSGDVWVDGKLHMNPFIPRSVSILREKYEMTNMEVFKKLVKEKLNRLAAASPIDSF